MKILLVCGYRRTGKDEFHKIMSGQVLPDRFKWRIYAHPIHLLVKLVPDSSFEQIAFAYKLKLEASEVYGIPLIVSDADKDIKQFRHYQTGEIVSARDIYIEWGAIRRAEDPDYWCRTAFESTKDSKNYIVTDWRFLNEGDYASRSYKELITVRLYRTDVPEPAADIKSEHELDEFQTDLLLLRDDMPGEFEKAIVKFPQYAAYVPIGTL